jgi:hypothetical protein
MPVDISLVSDQVRPDEDEEVEVDPNLQFVSPGDVITRSDEVILRTRSF